ncbi:alpha-amylase A-like [Anopheles darlingi]|uniref:alpha-amylase A-like n=1 Tax=Anopheles darlingi TaxID=43151 RepID=UPI00210058DA|nr:alpha-amylase A-like [Anopheles darlingi]
MVQLLAAGLFALFGSVAFAQFDPHFKPGHQTIVQLFEWRYQHIEHECRSYLGPHGFGGVQLSPVNEVRDSRPPTWTNRYEPISYKLSGRSGSETALQSMITACNEAGVRVYVEVVFNHMARASAGEAATTTRGTAGSIVNPATRDYPDAPYIAADFNDPCTIVNANDPHELRNCWKEDRPDLNHGLARVRQRIVDYLNRLLALGVAGFFIDSALYMWPHDLRAIYDRLQNLSTTVSAGYAPGARPFVCYDLSYHQPGVTPNISWKEYAELGVLTQDRFALDIGEVLLRRKPFHYFVHLGTRLGYMPRERALIYVNNPALLRQPDADGDLLVVSMRNARAYRIALAFMLAHRYGLARITSSYEFSNLTEGPPVDAQGQIAPVQYSADGGCLRPWICEHRWPTVAKMVQFRRATKGTGIASWVDNGQNQIGFCRDRSGFVAFNAEISLTLKAKLYTCLEAGTYCDLISDAALLEGDSGAECRGTQVVVDEDGQADIFIKTQLEEPFVALLATKKLN